MKNVASTFKANLLILQVPGCMQIAHTPRVCVARVCLCVCLRVCVTRQPATGTLALWLAAKNGSRLKGGYQSIRSSSSGLSRAEYNNLLRFAAHTLQVAATWAFCAALGHQHAAVAPRCCCYCCCCSMLHYPLAIVHCT